MWVLNNDGRQLQTPPDYLYFKYIYYENILYFHKLYIFIFKTKRHFRLVLALANFNVIILYITLNSSTVISNYFQIRPSRCSISVDGSVCHFNWVWPPWQCCTINISSSMKNNIFFSVQTRTTMDFFQVLL